MTRQGKIPKVPLEMRPAWVQRLVAARNAAGLTQDKFAGDVGIPQTTYGGWESGAAEPKFAELELVAKHLGVAPESIAFGGGEPGQDGAFTGALIERYKKEDGFVPTFFHTAAMLDEEGFNTDLHFAVNVAIRLFKKIQSGPDDVSLRDRIGAAVIEERAQIRAEIERVRKNRSQP